MRRITFTFMILAALAVLFAVPAFAFSWNPVDWMKAGLEAGGMKLLAWILTTLLGLAVFGSVLAVKIISTLKEAGELMTTLGNALADRSITTDELRQIANDARDVFNIWKETPAEYKPKAE
jgi:hypothetical protein